jgi:hypothetical protein
MKVALYRYFNVDGELIYIGVTKNSPYRRWRGHKQNTRWVNEIAAITIQYFDHIWAASSAEYVAIAAEKPLYNKHKLAIIHGTETAYSRRCRCDICCKAHNLRRRPQQLRRLNALATV